MLSNLKELAKKNLVRETEEEWLEGWEEYQEIWQLPRDLIASCGSCSAERSNKIKTGTCPLDWIWQFKGYC